jgi:protein-S-isoprenylcysteine O-methyltransferase Ste14
MVRRVLMLAYGVACYAVFFVTFLYAIGFIGNLVVPKGIDGAPTSPLGRAILINAGLLLAFALQHSVMARPGFKRWWTGFVPEAAERSTYVLLSSVALIALFYYWEPMGGTIWNVTNPFGQATLLTLFVLGYAIVLVATFLINHFDLFGLRQTWLYFRATPYTPLKFGTPGLYRHVRHPLYVGWLLGFWATPHMTAAHLLFAVLTTVYILVAIWFEERDLMTFHGEEYRAYRKTVPMLIPRPRKTGSRKPAAMAAEPVPA